LVKGKVAVSGGPELAQKLEEQGYAWILGAEETSTDAQPGPAP